MDMTDKKTYKKPPYMGFFLTITSAEEYEDWKAELLMFDIQNDKFVSIEEGYKINENLEADDYLHKALTWNEFYYNVMGYNEMMFNSYMTENGDEIIAFGFCP